MSQSKSLSQSGNLFRIDVSRCVKRSFYVEKELFEQIMSIAIFHDASVSYVLNQLIRYYLMNFLDIPDSFSQED